MSKLRMVSSSIEPLKASVTRGLTLESRLTTWAVASIDSAYSALAVDIQIFLS